MIQRSAALAVLVTMGFLGGCSSGGGAFAPLAAGAIAPSTSAPTAKPSTTASPTPTPTPVATPTPGLLSVSPTSLAIGGPNPTNATFNATETNYGGSFTESDNCSGVATIVEGQSSYESLSNGTSSSEQQFNVSQIAAGTCVAEVSDNHGGGISVAVISTTSSVIIESHGRP